MLPMGVDMIPKLPTPVEVTTGVPLALCPNPQLPPTTGRGVYNADRVADWHHPFFPRRYVKGLGLAGRALRASRVQWMLYDDHHEDKGGLHTFYDGPDLPATEDQWFRTVVLASADYVPAHGIDFHRNGEPYERTLRTNERLRLLNWGMIRVSNYNEVKPYLLEYVVRHGMSMINELLVDEFLHTSNLHRKEAIGEHLIREASQVAAEPLQDEYRVAKKEHFLPHKRTRSVANFIGNLLTLRAEPGREIDSATILSLENHLAVA